MPGKRKGSQLADGSGWGRAAAAFAGAGDADGAMGSEGELERASLPLRSSEGARPQASQLHLLLQRASQLHLHHRLQANQLHLLLQRASKLRLHFRLLPLA